MFLNTFHPSIAEILVLVGGAIPPAPVVSASTRISVRLKIVGNIVHLCILAVFERFRAKATPSARCSVIV